MNENEEELISNEFIDYVESEGFEEHVKNKIYSDYQDTGIDKLLINSNLT
jgi:hypothetical protein